MAKVIAVIAAPKKRRPTGTALTDQVAGGLTGSVPAMHKAERASELMSGARLTISVIHRRPQANRKTCV
jgi:hypothetical protein